MNNPACDASHSNSIIFEIWTFYPCFIRSPPESSAKVSGDFVYTEKVEAKENYFNGDLID